MEFLNNAIRGGNGNVSRYNFAIQEIQSIMID